MIRKVTIAVLVCAFIIALAGTFRVDPKVFSPPGTNQRVDVITVTNDLRASGILNSRLSAVYFWAKWCRPCRQLAPVIESIAEQYAGRIPVGKVDYDALPELAERHEIDGIPTLLILEDGIEIKRFRLDIRQREVTAEFDRLLKSE